MLIAKLIIAIRRQVLSRFLLGKGDDIICYLIAWIALTVGAMTSIHVFALVLIGAVHNLNTFDDTCVTWETTGACEFRGEIKL